MHIRIATRKSKLALVQANHVGNLIKSLNKDISIEIVEVVTSGDLQSLKFNSFNHDDDLVSKNFNHLHTETNTLNANTKALFTKEIEQSILENKADIAVHSAKDLSIQMPEEFDIIFIKRDDPRDALISKNSLELSELKADCVIGTSSIRRAMQILQLKPNAKIKLLRGNVDTRINKLKSEIDIDAILLAYSGLKRLNLEHLVTEILDINSNLPQAGQGAICIQFLKKNHEIFDILKDVEDQSTKYCVSAERECASIIGSNCNMPIAIYAQILNDYLECRCMYGEVDNSHKLSFSNIKHAFSKAKISSQGNFLINAAGIAMAVGQDCAKNLT